MILGFIDLKKCRVEEALLTEGVVSFLAHRAYLFVEKNRQTISAP